MPRFVIERNVPGAGALSPIQLREVSQKSCDVLRALGSEIQWIESWVTADRIYCVYLAPDETLIREHAAKSGFPADRIARVSHRIDPSTAEAAAEFPAA